MNLRPQHPPPPMRHGLTNVTFCCDNAICCPLVIVIMAVNLWTSDTSLCQGSSLRFWLHIRRGSAPYASHPKARQLGGRSCTQQRTDTSHGVRRNSTGMVVCGTGEGSQRTSDHTVPSESPSLVPSTHVLYGHLMGIHTHIHVNKNRGVTF